ncbi:MAG: hypothetical protein DI535_17455 [Citrobacter freundii]|nr:MAG: hypothetical protein DI535_17455 [Citrobacter freundii]
MAILQVNGLHFRAGSLNEHKRVFGIRFDVIPGKTLFLPVLPQTLKNTREPASDIGQTLNK